MLLCIALSGGVGVWALRAEAICGHERKSAYSPHEKMHTSNLSVLAAPEPPLQYLQPQSSAIKCVSWIQLPPSNADGAAQLGKPPCLVASTSYDGTVFLSDMRDTGFAAQIGQPTRCERGHVVRTLICL